VAHAPEHYEFDLSHGDRLVIGDLILTLNDIATGETTLLVEAARDNECEVNSPLAQVVCD